MSPRKSYLKSYFPAKSSFDTLLTFEKDKVNAKVMVPKVASIHLKKEGSIPEDARFYRGIEANDSKFENGTKLEQGESNINHQSTKIFKFYQRCVEFYQS